MKKEKYEFRGTGSPRSNFPTDGSLKKKYLSKALHLYFEDGMSYRAISEILPISFASTGYWIRNFAKEFKPKTEIMEAISNLDKSSREEITKTNNKAQSTNNTESLVLELTRIKEELKYQRI